VANALSLRAGWQMPASELGVSVNEADPFERAPKAAEMMNVSGRR